jgi:hypothetical protein
MSQATYDDVNLILRLYEIRREEKLRAARTWFGTNFKFKTMAEFTAACPPGSEANAYMRQVISYWDMVSSFILAGVLNQELFFQSGGELLFVWTRLEPLITDLRATFKDPNYWKNLEAVGKSFAEFLNKQSPGTYESFLTRVRG